MQSTLNRVKDEKQGSQLAAGSVWLYSALRSHVTNEL